MMAFKLSFIVAAVLLQFLMKNVESMPMHPTETTPTTAASGQDSLIDLTDFDPLSKGANTPAPVPVESSATSNNVPPPVPARPRPAHSRSQASTQQPDSPPFSFPSSPSQSDRPRPSSNPIPFTRSPSPSGMDQHHPFGGRPSSHDADQSTKRDNTREIQGILSQVRGEIDRAIIILGEGRRPTGFGGFGGALMHTDSDGSGKIEFPSSPSAPAPSFPPAFPPPLPPSFPPSYGSETQSHRRTTSQHTQSQSGYHSPQQGAFL